MCQLYCAFCNLILFSFKFYYKLIVLLNEWIMFIYVCYFIFWYLLFFFFFFFFQAEDGIRDADVTGVQTCALPICWLMLPIRANTQIPINENKPSDAAELLDYYNRKQYGSRSLFYDTSFTIKYGRALDADKPYKDGKVDYERDEVTGKYMVLNDGKNSEENYASRYKSFLPRMWSIDGSHPANYMAFTRPVDFKLKEDNELLSVFQREYRQQLTREDFEQLKTELMQMESHIKSNVQTDQYSLREYDYYLSQMSDYINVEIPSFTDNMKFMFNYQFGYMYMRYLMWNFAGRQNDIQGYNDHRDGNWITGIKFLDEIQIGRAS